MRISKFDRRIQGALIRPGLAAEDNTLAEMAGSIT
jgi:hypothetical protein